MEDVGIRKPAMTKQQAAFTNSERSGLSLYKELSVGDASWLYLLRYELSTFLFGNLTGILGYGARSVIYPSLFKECGRRPGIGRGVTLRQPMSISLGRKILIDDYATLDVRGKGGMIKVGDHSVIGRFSAIIAKPSEVVIGNGVNIGSYARIASESRIEIGDSTLVAAYVYIGPGNHQVGDDSKPLIEQDMENKGGVKIGAHVWIGTRATILDGVTIGDRAIIGAHSLVKSDIPAGAVAVGSPARVIKQI